MPAKFVSISPRLEYFFCEECKKEVLDLPPPPPLGEDISELFMDNNPPGYQYRLNLGDE
jgi:hypothetical protein